MTSSPLSFRGPRKWPVAISVEATPRPFVIARTRSVRNNLRIHFCHCEERSDEAISGSWVAIGRYFPGVREKRDCFVVLSVLLAMTKEGGTPRNDGEKEELLAMTKGRSRYFFQRLKRKGITVIPIEGQNYALKIKSAPERIRTSDLRLRRPSLYPTELRAQHKPHSSLRKISFIRIRAEAADLAFSSSFILINFIVSSKLGISTYSRAFTLRFVLSIS